MNDKLRPLTIIEASEYVKEKTGLDRNRGTFYNWVKKGIKVNRVPVILGHTYIANQVYTTETDIDLFLANTGSNR